jgi:hypothetical protein
VKQLKPTVEYHGRQPEKFNSLLAARGFAPPIFPRRPRRQRPGHNACMLALPRNEYGLFYGSLVAKNAAKRLTFVPRRG